MDSKKLGANLAHCPRDIKKIERGKVSPTCSALLHLPESRGSPTASWAMPARQKHHFHINHFV